MSKGLSQEKLSELSGCHPTYIGQIERGEKNATIESIAKISAALEIPLSKLFEQFGEEEHVAKSIPLECYEFISSKSFAQQKQILRILMEIDKYKGN
jgi:transcriptional regulator with XRE-family HTH domain